MPRARVGLFAMAALAAFYLGFVYFSVDEARATVRGTGYYVMLLTFVLWLVACGRSWRRRAVGDPAAPAGKDWLLGFLLIGAMTGLALAHETFRSKILYDEYVLQSTAYNLHFFRDNSAMVRGYEIQGVFISTDSYVDKRPMFFSFVLSLVHDLTGYRRENVFLLNSLLCVVTLGLAWWVGWRLNGRKGALLAAGLLGSLPLFTQNASGAGMELLNLCMLFVVIIAACGWLERLDESRLDVFVLSVVLFAQTRYESAAYVLPAALAIALGWWRARRMVVSWGVIAAPLLMVPVALLQKVISNSPIMWELRENQTSRFSVEYLVENLQGAWTFFSSVGFVYANSLLLGPLGFLALGFIAWKLGRNRRQTAWFTPLRLALLLFGAGILGVTTLIMFYYWAALNDPMASRFALPFHLLLVLGVVAAAACLDRRWPVSWVLLAAVGLFTFGSSAPKQSYHFYSHLGNDEIEWERRIVAARPAGSRLVISNKSTLPWLIDQTPSILLERSRGVADRLAAQLAMPDFREILVTQGMRPASREGDYELPPEDRLPEWFELELLAERRFGTKLARISRLVAVRLPADFKASTPQPVTSGEAGAHPN
jgi:hypothetical protein